MALLQVFVADEWLGLARCIISRCQIYFFKPCETDPFIQAPKGTGLGKL